MIRPWRIVLVLAVPLGTSISLAGGPMDVLSAEYKSLVHSRMGRIEMCGIHFSAALSSLSDPGRYFGIQGSINASFSSDTVPAILLKLAAVEARDGTTHRHKVGTAYLRAGSHSTASYRTFQGEDGFSILTFADMQTDGEKILELPHVFGSEGAQIGFNIDGQQDYTFALPPPESQVALEFNQCSLEGIQALQNELDR